MTITEHTLKSNELEPVRRVEIFTGAGRRRGWSAADKARIVAESYEPGETVSGVARRHALSAQQLFGWRRAARLAIAGAATSENLFVPAVVDAVGQKVAAELPSPRHSRTRNAARQAGMIELEIDGIAMRVGRGADARTVAAVIRALRATS